MHPLAIFAFLSLTLLPRVLGVRILVDDANSTFSYEYDPDRLSDWTAVSPSHPCSDCTLQPDPARAIGGTWHYSTSNTSANILFVGVAIEIYTIIPPDFNTTAPNIWYFELDDEDDGYFQAPERPNLGSYAYNFLAYARSDMTYANHTVKISNRSPSLILLDYAIYDDGVSAPSCSTTARTSATSAASATPSRSASGTHSPADAAIAAGIVAGMSLLANVLLIWNC